MEENDTTLEQFAREIVQLSTDENGDPKRGLSVPALRYLNLAQEYLRLKEEERKWLDQEK
jgi:hypothetical protein